MHNPIKEKINKAPDSCGVYLIKDAQANIIYAGKAASIKKRLRSHFSKSTTSAKQQAMIESAYDIDYIPASSPEAALLLEAALTKRYSPKYNVALKDDKAYPVLKLTIKEEFPRLFITRRKAEDGSLYFGPYTNAKLLRKALKLMGRLFPLRSCRIIPSKPCLDFHIGQCLAPCIGKINSQDFRLDCVMPVPCADEQTYGGIFITVVVQRSQQIAAIIQNVFLKELPADEKGLITIEKW